MRKERINEIWGIFCLLLGLFSLASLVFFHPEDLAFYTSHPLNPGHNVTGLIGAYLAFGLFMTFGVSALLIPLLFLLWAVCFFLQRVPERRFLKFAGLATALFSASTIVAVSVPEAARFEQAGAIGYLVGSHLLKYFGRLGSYILAGSCLLLAVLLATDFLIYPLVKRMLKTGQKMVGSWVELLRVFGKIFFFKPSFGGNRKPEKSAPLRPEVPLKLKPVKEKTENFTTALQQIPIKVKQYRPDIPEAPEKTQEKAPLPARESSRGKDANEKILKAAEALKEEAAREAAKLQPARSQPQEKAGAPEAPPAHFEGVIATKARSSDYAFPPIDLLKRPQLGAAPLDNLQGNSKILEDTLAEFGIEVKVVEVEQGPVITRYEILPAPGVKVNSIAALSDDIALALKAASVRLIIPIPGKSAVGVEVPNSVANVVYLRELVESSIFRSKKYALPLCLGKDTSGKPLLADLTSMPHLLIAGTTGSGKTVCVNSIITGFLHGCSPDELKLVMIDPKMVELAVYNKIPHMLTPVVTDVKKAAHTLNWVVLEMENRYKLFATVGVRNIQAFNSRTISEESLVEIQEAESPNVVPARLPYIVIIIDELADLMMVAQDKVEGAITRLAQLSRAVGIHLILATQRPSVDVITGVIKANFPARISFKVASKVDSRTVLDTSGADKLIGKGDMLFMQPGAEKPIRGQASFIVDEEINAVVKFVSQQAKPEYHSEIFSAQEGKSAGGVMEKDELFDEAVAIVLETGQASTSNLQRRLRLGYTRAARIIDQMEADGVIGPAQGAKPRDILIDRKSPETVSSDL